MSKCDFIPNCHNFNQAFIFNSNAIDPQPGYKGNEPGCPMYENHMAALSFALDNELEFSKSIALDIHRFLTKGIPFFERENASGQYRNCQVYIGNSTCPPPYLLDNLMSTWHSYTVELINSKIEPMEAAWISHHMFEIIHPFIDGNGRTGRLLLNKVLTTMGLDPVIVYYADRYKYYDSINAFRKRHFSQNQFVDLDQYTKEG